jgi:hypothetical protein
LLFCRVQLNTAAPFLLKPAKSKEAKASLTVVKVTIGQIWGQVPDRPQGGADGIVSEGRKGLLGESWSNGKVILAWDNVLHGSSNFVDGQNVVLHEFAHQLDSESGSADGAPLLAGKSCYRSWAAALSQEFEELQKDSRYDRRSLMDHYGATNPAEFFAVATETFFEKPRQMAKNHSDLFRVLHEYYRIDPRDWL